MPKLTRRAFLGGFGALGAASLPSWFPRLAFAAPGRAAAQRETLVCLFLRGGADGVNVVVPFGDAHYYENRPTIGIQEPGAGAGRALDLDGYFGFHPSLGALKEVWNDGGLAVVQAAGMPVNNHSHFDSMDWMERGTPGERVLLSGWLGRHLAAVDPANTSPFRAIGFGDLVQASLRGTVPATALDSIADFHLQGFEDQVSRFQGTLASLYSGTTFLDVQALQTFGAVDRLAAVDPGQYAPANGATYPDSDFGNAMKQIGQLIKADLGLEVACVDLGGWDMHDTENDQMPDLLADLGAGLQAFYTDLHDRIGTVTVVTMTEFGRRIQENASGGTDHGTASFMFLMGGGINGRKVYGSWPTLAPDALADPGDLAVTTDYRTVLSEILERRLGNPQVSQVFPDFPAGGYLGVCKA
ncbi:MAG TPA: DUF1501 domain-containing protein [Thermoanaerobaculia bacterium]|nr:DUF1501 domain-containing protein [Thermoanaerobaculia bacterium]